MNFTAMLAMLITAFTTSIGSGSVRVPDMFSIAQPRLDGILRVVEDAGVKDLENLEGVDVDKLYENLKEETSDLFTIVKADDNSITLRLADGQEATVDWSMIPYLDESTTKLLVEEAQKLINE